jgi:biopolymer transport protein ExbD
VALQAPPTNDAAVDEADEPSFFAEINITPLTDVVLVLLIIFMVASGAMVEASRQGQLGVELPHAGGGTQRPVAQDPVVVSVLRDGRVAVSGTVVSDDDLETTLIARLKDDPKAPLLIEADGDLAHKRVVFVIDVAQRAGFAEVGVAVAPD